MVFVHVSPCTIVARLCCFALPTYGCVNSHTNICMCTTVFAHGRRVQHKHEARAVPSHIVCQRVSPGVPVVGSYVVHIMRACFHIDQNRSCVRTQLYAYGCFMRTLCGVEQRIDIDIDTVKKTQQQQQQNSSSSSTVAVNDISSTRL